MIFFAFSYFVNTLLKESYNKLDNVSFLGLNSNIKICFIIAIVINIFPLVPSGNFFNNWMSIVYYYPLAIFFAYNHR